MHKLITREAIILMAAEKLVKDPTIDELDFDDIMQITGRCFDTLEYSHANEAAIIKYKNDNYPHSNKDVLRLIKTLLKKCMVNQDANGEDNK